MGSELSRRDFFRNVGVAGIGFAALRDVAWPLSKPETAFYRR